MKLNSEREGRELAAQYRVQGLPTILFLTYEGKEVHRIEGYMPPEDFAKEMDQAISAPR